MLTEPAEGKWPHLAPGRRVQAPFRCLSRPSTIATRFRERGVTACSVHPLRAIVRTRFGQAQLSAGIEAFWKKIVDELDDFPM